MEDIQLRVKYIDRVFQLMDMPSSVLTTTVADMIEQAYIAGANRYVPSQGYPPKTFLETGMLLVDARNYVKDKGFRP